MVLLLVVMLITMCTASQGNGQLKTLPTGGVSVAVSPKVVTSDDPSFIIILKSTENVDDIVEITISPIEKKIIQEIKSGEEVQIPVDIQVEENMTLTITTISKNLNQSSQTGLLIIKK